MHCAGVCSKLMNPGYRDRVYDIHTHYWAINYLKFTRPTFINIYITYFVHYIYMFVCLYVCIYVYFTANIYSF